MQEVFIGFVAGSMLTAIGAQFYLLHLINKRTKLPHELNPSKLSYHDVHVTTSELPRTSIFNLPFGYQLSCCRVGGWSFSYYDERTNQYKSMAGEYDGADEWLVIDVAGTIILDTRLAEE